MAGDWIKFEHGTPDKPEVATMADGLRMDPDEVVGKLLRVWVWADQNSVKGNAVAVTEAFLDRLTRKRGFAAAMRAVGWLEGAEGALVFPGFCRHNGSTAKGRADTNRRVAEHRMRNGKDVTNVTGEALQKPLPEKRREDEHSTSAPPTPRGGAWRILAGFDPDGRERWETGDAADLVALYPRRERCAEAVAEVARQLADGINPGAIRDGTRACAAVLSQLPSGALNKYVPSALNFFRKKLWADDPQTLLRQCSGATNGAARTKLDLGGRRAAEEIDIPAE
jgi:hypothetical protein